MPNESMCFWCDEPIGRARAVTHDDADAEWHSRCWEPWRRAQGFKRGRAPQKREVIDA